MLLFKRYATQITGLAIIFVVIVIALSNKTSAIAFHETASEKIPVILAYLFLVSMILERAIDVFLSAWRTENASRMDLKISQITADIKGATDKKKTMLNRQLKTLQKKRSSYSAKSGVYAQWMGLIFGALISLVGIRVLNHIVSVENLSDIQQLLFTSVDILITAATLAGGSSAINQIMQLYTGFLSSTLKKTRDQAE